MTPEELSIDGLAAQEVESLAACIAREQEPSSYADIVAKIRAHCDRLPESRRVFWSEQCRALGVTLYPRKKAKDDLKAGGTSAPS